MTNVEISLYSGQSRPSPLSSPTYSMYTNVGSEARNEAECRKEAPSTALRFATSLTTNTPVQYEFFIFISFDSHSISMATQQSLPKRDVSRTHEKPF